jgi:hypothetical protein
VFFVYLSCTGLIATCNDRTDATNISLTFALILITALVFLATRPITRRHKAISGLLPYEDLTKMGKYLGDGKFAKLTEQGKYAIQKLSMTCDFPDCNGTVYITLPRSEERKYFTACCSLDSLVHRYKVTGNGIATRIE